MPLQASRQWDGLGHIFDHGRAWKGRRAGDVVTSEGDHVTGIETVGGRLAGRGVLVDVGRTFGAGGVLPDGFAITAEHLEATIRAQGESSHVGGGDLVVVRTGRLTRARHEGGGENAGAPRASGSQPTTTSPTSPVATCSASTSPRGQASAGRRVRAWSAVTKTRRLPCWTTTHSGWPSSWWTARSPPTP